MLVRPLLRRLYSLVALALSLAGLCIAWAGFAAAQVERHGRGFKPLPPTAEVVVMVQKGFNQKPLPNASVIFRAMRDDKITANLETKTDPDGRASLDLLEVGSHVTIQVIANGFATYAANFDLTGGGKQLLVKLERPREQISHYGQLQDRPAVTEPGVQEHGGTSTPTAVPPATASPTGPLQTTPPVNPPAKTSPATAPAKPGNPQ